MRALAPKQKVSIFVNEKPVTTVDVDGATKRYDVAVPAASLKLGDNRVRLTFKSAANVPGGKRSAASLKLVAFVARNRPPDDFARHWRSLLTPPA